MCLDWELGGPSKAGGNCDMQVWMGYVRLLRWVVLSRSGEKHDGRKGQEE